jgi:hypothetical protein
MRDRGSGAEHPAGYEVDGEPRRDTREFAKGRKRNELFLLDNKAPIRGESGEGFSSCDEGCEEIVVPGGGFLFDFQTGLVLKFLLAGECGDVFDEVESGVIVAMLAGPFSVRRRIRSSWNTASSAQWRRFSTPQWARAA